MMDVPFHYQFRIIVIGDSTVGKSSLLKTFSEGTFSHIEPTVGVDFFSKIIGIRPKQRTITSNNTESFRNNTISNNNLDDRLIIKLQIWDTAGQERFKSIVTSYYRNSIGIVLVYDITNRESYEHLLDWFTEARRHVEPTPSPTLSPITQNTPSNYHFPLTSTPNNTPSNRTRLSNGNQIGTTAGVANSNNNNHISFNSMLEQNPIQQFKMVYLVLGCKSDLASERQVSYEEGKTFADLYGFKFLETSSKNNHNVDLAFQTMAEEIYYRLCELNPTNGLFNSPSGPHVISSQTNSQFNEGIKVGPLISNQNSRFDQTTILGSRPLLEAQPVSSMLGGCC